jgi:hypothetical protein
MSAQKPAPPIDAAQLLSLDRPNVHSTLHDTCRARAPMSPCNVAMDVSLPALQTLWTAIAPRQDRTYKQRI